MKIEFIFQSGLVVFMRGDKRLWEMGPRILYTGYTRQGVFYEKHPGRLFFFCERMTNTTEETTEKNPTKNRTFFDQNKYWEDTGFQNSGLRFAFGHFIHSIQSSTKFHRISSHFQCGVCVTHVRWNLLCVSKINAFL